jgi:hypothetical protein
MAACCNAPVSPVGSLSVEKRWMPTRLRCLIVAENPATSILSISTSHRSIQPVSECGYGTLYFTVSATLDLSPSPRSTRSAMQVSSCGWVEARATGRGVEARENLPHYLMAPRRTSEPAALLTPLACS